MSWLRPGDIAPDFTLPASSNPAFHFALACGSYVVLSFFGSAAHPAGHRMLSQLTEGGRRFDDDRLRFFGVSVDQADRSAEIVQSCIRICGARLLWDTKREISVRYGVADPPPSTKYRLWSLILDPALRVIASIPFLEREDHAARIWQVIDALPDPGMYGADWINAPVLTVPSIFEASFCTELIGLYERHGGRPSGFMTERDGITVGANDPQFKRRRDFEIADEAIRTAVRTRINRRLTPAILLAFQFAATRIERYVVACYDAVEGGFFKPHQDNTTKGTAHRRFAVTINLNADDYDGGDLRFPAFGRRTYRPPTGGALVFSCSLIHEALPVTRGRRYAFLPFVYDEAAQQLREENLPFLSLAAPDASRTS